MKTGTYIIAVLAVMAVFLPEILASQPPEIRVLVIDSVPKAFIEGIGSPLSAVSESGNCSGIKSKGVTISATQSGLLVGRSQCGNSIVISNKNERYRISGRSFRGSITAVWKSNGSLMIIARMPLEDYLAGLINSEISSSWPVESIKAQAVAARTYAMNQIEGAQNAAKARPFDITSTMLDQVYEGAHLEDNRSRLAVADTRGEMLLRNGEIFPAYYHSSCGGHTERAENVWEGERGPPVIDDPYCSQSPKFTWSYNIPVSRFAEIMNGQGTPISTVRTIATSVLQDSPRVDMLLVEDDQGLKMIRATELRRIFGYQNIKSTWFEANLRGGSISFTGRGYGHGVGLCQWGAKGMAEEGIGYRDILKFYYPDADVARLY